MGKKHLDKAKKEKNDEFYTFYEDIEKELIHYKDQLKDKIIYCNCDTEDSNFWKYFKDNFKRLELKKIMASSILTNKLITYNGDEFLEKEIDGDFKSEECLSVLSECDIVITNPPFSKFRLFLRTLIDSEKKFLIIGPQLSMSAKYIFDEFLKSKFHLGYNNGKSIKFINKDEIRPVCINWITNLSVCNNLKKIDINKTYDKNYYKKIDNYDVININKIKDIPIDYYNEMAVPISIFEYNLEGLFNIVYLMNKDIKIDNKGIFARIVIKRV